MTLIITQQLKNIQDMIEERQKLYNYYKNLKMFIKADQMMSNIKLLHDVKTEVFEVDNNIKVKLVTNNEE